MARNLQTFESGNRVGLKLTPELAELFINTVRQTGRISIAAGRCAIGTQTARDWLRKGRREDAEPIYKEFADSVEKARAEFLALAAKRLAQLAIGGTIDLPAYDKQNRLIRDANDEIIFEPRYFPPNPNALMHILDRIDPEPNLAPPTPEVFGAPALSEEAQMSRALANYALTKQALQIFVDLGVDISALPQTQWCAGLEAEMLAIETTATAAPAETAKESVVSADANPPTEPPDKPPEAF